jgi:hypothetical protein
MSKARVLPESATASCTGRRRSARSSSIRTPQPYRKVTSAVDFSHQGFRVPFANSIHKLRPNRCTHTTLRIGECEMKRDLLDRKGYGSPNIRRPPCGPRVGRPRLCIGQYRGEERCRCGLVTGVRRGERSNATYGERRSAARIGVGTRRPRGPKCLRYGRAGGPACRLSAQCPPSMCAVHPRRRTTLTK